MKILYDPQIFTWQCYGGISRYYYELMSYFYKSKDIDFELPLIHSYNHYLENSEFSKHFSFLKDKNFYKKDEILFHLNKLNKALLKVALKKQNFDIVHPTYYDTYFLKHIKNKPFVLTIYDLIHEKFPEIFPSMDKAGDLKKELIYKADKIIAISENTKKDIIEYYNIDPDKIKVTYLANSFDKFYENTNVDINLPERYILYVGDRWTYKNFKFFIASINNLLKNDENLKVIAAGSKPFDEEEINFLKTMGISDKVVHYKVTDKILIELYKNALVFVFPSRYEGFGIPVLESLSCGCPLIVSNQGSLPEVAGEACIYIDPYDKNSIENAVNKVIFDQNLRLSLAKKGFEQAQKFSWEKTAKETIKVYEGAI